jgi:hypothetical protein
MRFFIPFLLAGLILCPFAARSTPIEIEYVPPTDPEHLAVYERVKDLQVLESLRDFLRPFRLPRTLKMKIEGCDGESNAWYADGTVTVCYEYLLEVWQNAFKRTSFDGVTQVDVMLGPLFDVFLHEFGHAAFDLLDVPVFGREEDAADQFSAYIMLNMGKEEARRLILGTAYAYKIEAEGPSDELTMTKYADEHGTPAQRFYNLLCAAHGADPELFGDLVAKGYLPKDRAEGCEEEFAQLQKAFRRLIDPHIDQALAKEVMKSGWLPQRVKKLKKLEAPPARSESSRAN